MADKKDKKPLVPKIKTAHELNAQKIAESKANLQAAETKRLEAESKMPMRPSILKILNSIDGIKIDSVRELKKEEAEVCTGCAEKAKFSFPALNGEMIHACGEFCGLETLQTQFMAVYDDLKDKSAPQSRAQALAGANKIAEAMGEIPNFEKVRQPHQDELHAFTVKANEALKKATNENEKRLDKIGRNYEQRDSQDYKDQEIVRAQLQKVVNDEIIKSFDDENEQKYGATFSGLLEKFKDMKRKATDELRHKTIAVDMLKEQAKKRAEEKSELPLSGAIEALEKGFFDNENIRAFLDKAGPIMEERKKLQKQLDANEEKLAECNSLAMATKNAQTMHCAKPILALMKQFDRVVDIAKAEEERAEVQSSLQAKAEECLQELFKEIIDKQKGNEIEKIAKWDADHVPLVDPPKGTWAENLDEMKKALELATEMFSFMVERHHCFNLTMGKFFSTTLSKITNNKETAEAKEKATFWNDAYTKEKDAHKATESKVKELRLKIQAEENKTAEYKASYDDAKTQLEELKTLNTLAEKYFPKNTPKRASPGGWEKVKGAKKAKIEKKTAFYPTYIDEERVEVPYCHFQYTKIDGCSKGDECEQSETHGMDDPHPNHHTRNAVKAAQREAFEENQAKKAKEKKKKAASEAKGAAPAKPAKKQEKSGSDTEPDTKPDGPDEPKEKNAWA